MAQKQTLPLSLLPNASSDLRVSGGFSLPAEFSERKPLLLSLFLQEEAIVLMQPLWGIVQKYPVLSFPPLTTDTAKGVSLIPLVCLDFL